MPIEFDCVDIFDVQIHCKSIWQDYPFFVAVVFVRKAEAYAYFYQLTLLSTNLKRSNIPPDTIELVKTMLELKEKDLARRSFFTPISEQIQLLSHFKNPTHLLEDKTKA